MIPVRRLNHAVLFVRDAVRAAAFYAEAFGFEAVTTEADGRAVFLRARGSANHHDLGLFSVGDHAPSPPRGAVGLYHLAWEVDRIDDLVAARETLQRLGALVGASDHGATKSLYGRDADGNEFEVMWMVPRDQWGEYERSAIVAPLDLDAEMARHGTGPS
ncbi:MAG TPA: VOC family protein [Nitriliruptorales bacterium]|nr:VOC family protein [Nitriliruptorales bacterium]